MIIISAGHKLISKGACNGDVCEYDLAIEWIDIISSILETALVPHQVVPTGSLTSKVEFINNHNAIAAMELHFNSNVNAKGSETLYYPKSTKGKELSDMVQTGFENADIFQPNRGSKEAWYKMDQPGVVDYVGDVEGDEKIDYFVRKTNCTAVIVEPDFISNLDNIDQHQFEGCLTIANALTIFYYKYK